MLHPLIIMSGILSNPFLPFIKKCEDFTSQWLDSRKVKIYHQTQGKTKEDEDE